MRVLGAHFPSAQLKAPTPSRGVDAMGGSGTRIPFSPTKLQPPNPPTLSARIKMMVSLIQWNNRMLYSDSLVNF